MEVHGILTDESSDRCVLNFGHLTAVNSSGDGGTILSYTFDLFCPMSAGLLAHAASQ